MIAAVFLALGALASSANAQINFGGVCPTVTTAANFVPATFAATGWTENYRYYSMFESGARCVKWNFVADGTSMTATTTYPGGWSRTKTMISRLTQNNAAGNYYYVMTLDPRTGRSLGGTYNFKFVAFDLTANAEWALAWSCKNKGWFNSYHQEMLWVFTKGNTVSSTIMTAVRNAAATAGLTIDDQRLITVQQNC